MCENPVGFLGLLGFFGLKWVKVGLSALDLSIFSLFVCMCVWV